MNLSFKYLVIWYSIKTFIGRVIFEYSPKLIQDYRWRKLKRNHLSASPFYSSYVNSKAKLKDYPQIDKSIFMDNFDEINTRGIELMEATRVVLKAEKNRDFSPEINHLTVGLSTGTSGNKGVFLASQKERAIWVATILNRVIGWSLKKRKVAFFLRANSNLYESVGSSILSFNYFDILEPIESHIHRLNTLQPNIIVAQPSLLCLLSKSRFNNTLNINPTKIISVAEVLTPSDKKYIEDAFNQRIHQVYQCTEGFLAFTCKKGTLHMNEDFIHIEKHYIDHERFNPIITDLIRGTQPVIRYLLNDILIQGDKCDCGSNLMTLKLIDGRMDDVFKLKSNKGDIVNIFPDFLRRTIITSHDEIREYQLIQKDASNLSLYLHPSKHTNLVKKALITFFKKLHLYDVNINTSVTIYHEKGSKMRRIINEN